MMTNENQDKIIKKIEGLLRLAENADEDEAQTAFAMAQKLMLKNRIDEGDLDPHKDNDIDKAKKVFMTRDKSRLMWYEISLAQVVADNFRVRILISEESVMGKKTSSRISVFGLDEDIEIAINVYTLAFNDMLKRVKPAIADKVEELSEGNPVKTALIEGKYKNDIRKAFIAGYIRGLETKFEQQKEELKKQSNKYELAMIVPAIVDQKLASIETTDSVRQGPRITDGFGAYSDGYSAGKNSSVGEGNNRIDSFN